MEIQSVVLLINIWKSKCPEGIIFRLTAITRVVGSRGRISPLSMNISRFPVNCKPPRRLKRRWDFHFHFEICFLSLIANTSNYVPNSCLSRAVVESVIGFSSRNLSTRALCFPAITHVQVRPFYKWEWTEWTNEFVTMKFGKLSHIQTVASFVRQKFASIGVDQTQISRQNSYRSLLTFSPVTFLKQVKRAWKSRYEQEPKCVRIKENETWILM